MPARAHGSSSSSSGGYKPLDLEAPNSHLSSSAAAGSSNHAQQQWRSIDQLEREQARLEAAPLQQQQQQQGLRFGGADAAPGSHQQYSTRRGTLHRQLACGVFGALLLVFVVAAAGTTLHQYLAAPTRQQQQGAQLERGSRDLSSPSPAPGGNNSSSNGSSSSSSSARHRPLAAGTNASAGVWHEGGGEGLSFADLARPRGVRDAVPCIGPDLQCGVVNRQPIPEADFRNRSRCLVSRRGAVAADSSRCSEVGATTLASGGNAVDAAVATVLCQGVVNPMSSGLGGGAFISVRLANGTAAFWDAREYAPAAASRDMFGAAGVPSNASLYGGLAVAVPAELQGLEAAWRRFGSKPWPELVKPAAALARSGFAAHPYLVYILSGSSNLKRVMASRELREAFLIKAPGTRGGWRVPHVGELCCRRPALAHTLDQIAARGAAHLASPAITAAHAAELRAAGGIITAQDLAAAAPVERQLLRTNLGELELLVPPPPSSAAVVAFVLKFLAGYGNTRLRGATNSNSSSSSSREEVPPDFGAGLLAAADGGLGMHRLVEAFKHGFAIRTALGDPGAERQPGSGQPGTAAAAAPAAAAAEEEAAPAGASFPGASSIRAAVRDLLDDAFITRLRAATRDDGVMEDNEYGGRWNPRGVAPPEEHGTSHLSVVDEDRNAVSITTSINTPFGSGVVSPTSGIIFGNTMDDFSSPAKRTLVTPHPSEANFIAPGRRPLSAMSPLIVTHRPSGRLVAVAGASGGPLIVSATTQTLARLLLEGADVGPAVSAPRIHEQLLPSHDCYVEDYAFGAAPHRLAPAAAASLRARGQVVRASQRGIGVSQAVFVDYGGGSEGGTSADGVSGGHAGRRERRGSGGGGARGGPSRGVLIAQSDARKDGAPAGYD